MENLAIGLHPDYILEKRETNNTLRPESPNWIMDDIRYYNKNIIRRKKKDE